MASAKAIHQPQAPAHGVLHRVVRNPRSLTRLWSCGSELDTERARQSHDETSVEVEWKRGDTLCHERL